MKVFIIGATGYVGNAAARLLSSRGLTVSGTARSDAKAKQLAECGIEPVSADATDYARMVELAAAADVTIYAATGAFDREAELLAPVLERLTGSNKTFILTTGSAVLSIPTPDGAWREESFAEDDPWSTLERWQPRVRAEALVRESARRGIRTMVIRPPLIWGNGGSAQVPAVFYSVAKVQAACYVGAGLNCYSNVHVDDVAEVFALAIEHGKAGALYHAVGGEVSFREIAEAVAKVMRCKARSVTLEEGARIWGQFEVEVFYGVSSRCRAPRTRNELGWRPRHLDLIEDIRNGSYRKAFAPKS